MQSYYMNKTITQLSDFKKGFTAPTIQDKKGYSAPITQDKTNESHSIKPLLPTNKGKK